MVITINCYGQANLKTRIPRLSQFNKATRLTMSAIGRPWHFSHLKETWFPLFTTFIPIMKVEWFWIRIDETREWYLFWDVFRFLTDQTIVATLCVRMPFYRENRNLSESLKRILNDNYLSWPNWRWRWSFQNFQHRKHGILWKCWITKRKCTKAWFIAR